MSARTDTLKGLDQTGVPMGHKAFISFKFEDVNFKEAIKNIPGIDMIDKSLNEAINSENEDYIMQRIRAEYLADSTVTIHLIGTRSAASHGDWEQRFIKRELQASLYNGVANPKNGILGIVLPDVHSSIYKGDIQCGTCGSAHRNVNINLCTVVSEFSYNFYIPNDKCAWDEDDRYCVLTPWEDFYKNPNVWIDAAFNKRDAPISRKTKVKP